MLRKLVFLMIIAVLAACKNQDNPESIIPLYEGLSRYHRTVSTESKEAQAYFDQGLALYYGFNHEAAIRSFQQAIALDSNCVMAWWGQALSSGPNINNAEMDDNAKIAAWETIEKAREHFDRASPVEHGLISALTKRYAWPAPDDRRPLDVAYADAMRETFMAFPDDPDVATLYADALMNLRPWDLWTSDGIPQPGTEEIMATLEGVLEKHSEHPGASHFYIHTMEASPFPEKALPAANVLRNSMPGAGHLVHMPSHIDIRLGHYEDAIIANSKAIIADSIWIPAGGFYTMYRAHNYHFLAYAASGRVDEAASEYKALLEACDQVPDSRLIGNNPGKTVLDIGVLMAHGELEYRKGNYEHAFQLLREAVQKDDELRYDEPWGWMMPIRHSLGALLLEQSFYEEAEEVFNADLLLHPNNGWALKGLASCYHISGQHEKAMLTEQLFSKSWSRSDIDLKAACFCSKGT